MNLRHIDPRSTDWMDAMMDSDDEQPRAGRRRTPQGGIDVGLQAQPADATSGAAYKTAAGFDLPFGDYNMITINSAGKTVTVSGEGAATQSHGDSWVNRQY